MVASFSPQNIGIVDVRFFVARNAGNQLSEVHANLAQTDSHKVDLVYKTRITTTEHLGIRMDVHVRMLNKRSEHVHV